MRNKDLGKPLSRAVTVFYFSAFLLLFLRDYQWQGLALAIAVPLLNVATTAVLPRLFPADKLLLSLTNFLCALGVLMLYRTNPAYAYHQATYYFVGLLAMVVCIYVVRLIRSFRFLVWPMMLASLALLALPLVIGKETFGAKNWFYIGGLSVQPSEIVKLVLVIVLGSTTTYLGLMNIQLFHQLEQEKELTGDEEQLLRLDRRLRPLRAMYRDTRDVARHLERYYARTERRNCK